MRYVLATLVALLSFAGTALAASATMMVADASPDASWVDLVRPVMEAIISGHPLLAAALALVLAVTLARRYGGKRFPILATDAGGTALTFLGALGTAIAASLAGGALPSLSLLGNALVFAASASGGYTAIKRLAVPALRWLEGKAPAWMRPMLSPALSLLLWAFESRGEKRVKEAEAAGDAAVVAKPSAGAESVVKKGKSFP